MIVTDASVVVDVLVGRPPNRALLERLSTDDDLHAPHLLDLEVTGALTRLVASHLLSPDRAHDALDDFAALRIQRYAESALLERIWQLRRTVAPRDAAYLALAETLDVDLLTTDPYLAVAKGHRARVELYAAE